MKTHLIHKYHRTGDRVTHFRTKCGLIRHVTTISFASFASEDKSKVTCKNCLKLKL